LIKKLQSHIKYPSCMLHMFASFFAFYLFDSFSQNKIENQGRLDKN